MEQYFDLIKSHRLFCGLSDDEIELVFKNFPYRICEYKSGENVSEANTRFSLFILSGNLRVEKYGYDGVRNIVSTFYEGSMGSFPPEMSLTAETSINIVSNKNSVVLFMCCDDFTKPDYSLYSIQHKLMCNVIFLLDEINKYSYEFKIILSERSIRKKIARYLEIHQKRYNSNEFTVIYSRACLADYLGVDKSALSRELGNMKRDGLIDYSGNHFIICKDLGRL